MKPIPRKPHVQPDLPQEGWRYVRIDDARAPDSGCPRDGVRCDFCGRRLRWVHRLTHDESGRRSAAGCCCAERVCYGYDAAGAEREAKNRASRRVSFARSSAWRPSRNNPVNVWRRVKLAGGAKVLVTVFETNGAYKVVVNGPGDNKRFSDEWYATRAEAQMAAFDMLGL